MPGMWTTFPVAKACLDGWLRALSSPLSTTRIDEGTAGLLSRLRDVASSNS